jgi:hypothetical protein
MVKHLTILASSGHVHVFTWNASDSRSTRLTLKAIWKSREPGMGLSLLEALDAMLTVKDAAQHEPTKYERLMSAFANPAAHDAAIVELTGEQP